MVKRILKEEIWKKLTDRFKAYITIDKEQPKLLEEVQPITDIDELLKEYSIGSGTFARTAVAGTGVFSIWEPADRNRVRGFAFERVSGDGTIDEVYVHRVGALATRVRILIQTAAANAYSNVGAAFPVATLSQDIVLDPNYCGLSVQCAAISTDTVWNRYIYRTLEEAFG